MSGNWISNDSDDEGIFINAAGDVGIGTNSLTHRAEVSAGANNTLTSTRQALRIHGGTVTGTNADGVIAASSFINHGSGDGTATITSFQGICR